MDSWHAPVKSLPRPSTPTSLSHSQPLRPTIIFLIILGQDIGVNKLRDSLFNSQVITKPSNMLVAAVIMVVKQY